MTQQYTRSSCGFCMTAGRHKHKDCPGTLATARAGRPWTCWCFENGHPDVLPKPPKYVEDQAEEMPAVPQSQAPEAAPREHKAREPKELSPRCGAPTKRGPCKRKAGHTAGHDGR